MPLPKLLYFCVPPNDKLLGYWDTVADRLFKIRHCMNIEGVVRPLALFEPPIDPALLVRAAAAGVDLSSVLSESTAPMPHYRFRTLVQKAADLTRHVKELGQSLLAALEKRDAEMLAQLRAGQEVALLGLVEELRKQQVTEQTRQIDVLQASRKLADVRYLHYQRLLGIQDARVPGEGEPPASDPEPSAEAAILDEAGVKMTGREKTEQAKMKEATDKQQTSIGWELGANASYYIPTFATEIAPWGVGIKIEFGGQHVGPALRAIADWFKTESAGATYDSSSAARIGSFVLRAHEWLLQSKLAAREMSQTDAQIATARVREGIAVKELENHRAQIAQAKEIEDTLRTKFTNQELYNWMVGQTAATYFQAYQLAYDVAKRAERALRHELGLTDSNYIQFGYWDSLKKGLLAGDRLAHDLQRLEVAYLENNKREYEITKHVSLAMLHPAALVNLRENGSCLVELPEEIFDLDYPGHYLRRLKAVSLSIPCVTGPYTSVNCTLTLLANRIRKNTRTDPAYAFQGDDDPRFTVNSGGVQSIATSSGREDSGLFELSLQDERYLPFEGAGVISGWRIELPPDFRQFDYTTISDIILHLRYTARDGGAPLRSAALTSLTTTLKSMEIEDGTTGLYRLFSAAHDFPDAWHAFRFRPEGAPGAAELAVTLDPRRFPAHLRDRTLKLPDLTLFLKVAPGVAYDEGDPLILAVTPPGGAEQPVTLTPVETELGGLPAGQADYGGAPITLSAAQPPWRLTIAGLPAVLTEEVEVNGQSVQRLDPTKVTDLGLLCHYTY